MRDVVQVAPFSVLITTYAREKAEYLKLALDSLARQTLPARQIVLVIDGPIPESQEQVVSDYASRLSLNVVRLERNLGLAGALTHGLAACTQPWCARMDSDDIAETERFEKQWEILQAHPELDVVSTWTAEFEDQPDQILRYKTGPENHENIVRTLYWRNVVHHPTVVMRVEAIRKAGGYSMEYPLLEDYDLFLRLVGTGARFAILPSPLLRFRTNPDQRKRRGGFKYLRVEARFRYRTWLAGLVPGWITLLAFAAIVPFRLMPGWARGMAYGLVRKKA